ATPPNFCPSLSTPKIHAASDGFRVGELTTLQGTSSYGFAAVRSCPLSLPTFYGIPTEGPVLSADRGRLLIVIAIVPSLERVEAIPLLDGDALWWCSLK